MLTCAIYVTPYIKGVVQQLNAMNLSFGIYTAESSVVCSGRPGTLFNEVIDAQTFADWGVGQCLCRAWCS